jgi:hypothetical protein
MENATNPLSAKWSLDLKVEWGLAKFSRAKWYFDSDISNKNKYTINFYNK